MTRDFKMNRNIDTIRRGLILGTDDIGEFENALKSLAEEMDVEKHHCSKMPEDMILIRQRHQEVRNNKWSGWNWHFDRSFKYQNIYFCVYCMKNVDDF